MPPKLELPIKKIKELKKCHDKKIESLGTLIQKIFNTTDKSHGISKKVTDAIQKLIALTDKELNKPNLKKTIELIKRLQQTVGKDDTPDGLINSYKQVVKAIVEYANKIECPTAKPQINQNPIQLYLKNINKLINLDEALKVCKGSGLVCDKIVENNKGYEELYKELIKENVIISETSNIRQLMDFLENYHRDYESKYKDKDKGYEWYRFKYAGGGLLPYLKYKIEQSKRGGSKHHKTKTTKKRIKGKQTRRNKVKNKTTIKAKNKTTIKAKNKTKKR